MINFPETGLREGLLRRELAGRGRGRHCWRSVEPGGMDREPLGQELVGTGGFEPPASCSQSRRANQAALRPDSHLNRANSSLRVANISRMAVRARARWLMRFFTSGPSSAMVASYSSTQKTGS